MKYFSFRKSIRQILQRNSKYKFHIIYGNYSFSFGALTRFRDLASPYGASRSHLLDIPHSLQLVWKSDQLDTDTATENTQYSQETAMPPARFEPTIPASERPQTHALKYYLYYFTIIRVYICLRVWTHLSKMYALLATVSFTHLVTSWVENRIHAYVRFSNSHSSNPSPL